MSFCVCVGGGGAGWRTVVNSHEIKIFKVNNLVALETCYQTQTGGLINCRAAGPPF